MQKKAEIQDYELCFIKDLKPGHIVYEDLYVENRRLLSKGHVLSERIINILRNRNIRQILIEKNYVPSILPPNENEQLKYDAGHDYLRALGVLSSETRYGLLLNNSEDIQLLKTLFVHLMEDPTAFKLLSNLKNHDENTYIHSIDVFTLGILFSISEGVANIEQAALGFLFHDIGKLHTANILLDKKQGLTSNEFAIIQQHATQGHDILCNNGFGHIAHFAKSHHERIDGSGYPEGLCRHELSLELQILQLVDVYSAITMDRPYKESVTAVLAIEKIFKRVEQFNIDLLYRFIDFIGIYPENAVVLLSDGTQAIIEEVHPLYPLLPTVKVFQTNQIFQMPMDFSLTINKLLTFHTDSPQDLFSRFSDFLINNDEQQMRRYYEKLKEHYEESEWFTHIYLPVFHVLRVLENYNMVPELRFKEVKSTLVSLLENTLKHYRQNDYKKKKFVLILGELNRPAIVKLFEGLLHNNNMYPFISHAQQSKEDVEKLIKLCRAEGLIVIGDTLRQLPSVDIHYHHITEQQLETLLSQYLHSDLQNHHLLKDLESFSKTDHLLFV
ncbi:HD-GYP domain-containing protein [Solibacillus silvestris]|uniref:HD-GYP domain-containing protein n=1 Tax=Solibacillus silvestris TaxID=76853 RepID=UPI003F81430A